MKLKKAINADVIDIVIDQHNHPSTYNDLLTSLAEHSNAEIASKVPFQMELYYCKGQGLMAVEAGTSPIYNPYDGKKFDPEGTLYTVIVIEKMPKYETAVTSVVGVFDDMDLAKECVMSKLDQICTEKCIDVNNVVNNEDREWLYMNGGYWLHVKIEKNIINETK